MYKRNIFKELEKWKASATRKPLLIRGARQVGKTTIVHEFGKSYQKYMYLNLERKEEAKIFENYQTFEELVNSIFFIKNEQKNEEQTLIFIDEIQEVPDAINLLRYFKEDYPHLHVIAAGSLLETILKENQNTPVGRVQYLVLRPVTFQEFLSAMGETSALDQFKAMPMQSYAHEKLMQLFKTYVLIGGMPEIVQNYVKHKDLSALQEIYTSLIASYLTDVEKYAKNSSQVNVIRHIIKSMAVETGNRIKFEQFGQSNYGSREVGEAMRTLEKAFLMHLVYPSFSQSLPIFPDKKKSPRLHILDTGLMNFMAGIQKEIVLETDLEAVYHGKVIEHIVGQEILASKFNVLAELNFWTREKKDATAEIDFVYNHEGKLIPIEVKSGATGKLRSLHLYMENSPHAYAIRLYAEKIKIDTITLPSGKTYQLLNLPFYLAGDLERYLAWFLNEK
jgi:uncharacterized protein